MITRTVITVAMTAWILVAVCALGIMLTPTAQSPAEPRTPPSLQVGVQDVMAP